MKPKNEENHFQHQLWSTLFYFSSAVALSVVHRYCALYGGPPRQFQELSRLVLLIVIIKTAKTCNAISLPNCSTVLIKDIWPVSLMHVCGQIFTIGHIKELSSNVLTVINRTTVLFALLAEIVIFKNKTSATTYMCVFTILIGAVVGLASLEINFDLSRCIYVLINQTLFAAYVIFAKKIFNTTKYDVWTFLYYDSLISLIPIVIISYYSNDLESSLLNYMNWANIIFTLCFISSCIIEMLSSYFILSCTFYNGPLTTIMVDCLRDLSLTYLSMTVWDKYSQINIFATSIALIGCLIYLYDRFKRKHAHTPLNYA